MGGIRLFWGWLGCSGHSQKLYRYTEKQWWGTSFFYILNREKLEELLRLYVKENTLIYQICEKCCTCKRLYQIRERLDGAWFFRNRKRNEAPYQPTSKKTFLFSFQDNINFWIQMHAVKNER